MQIFTVRAERDASHARIHAGGELDLATAPRLEACVQEQLRDLTTTVEIDLREIAFIDSAGVRLLLTLDAQARHEGWTLTILPSDAVRYVVSLLGLQRRLLAPHAQADEETPLSAATG